MTDELTGAPCPDEPMVKISTVTYQCSTCGCILYASRGKNCQWMTTCLRVWSNGKACDGTMELTSFPAEDVLERLNAIHGELEELRQMIEGVEQRQKDQLQLIRSGFKYLGIWEKDFDGEGR